MFLVISHLQPNDLSIDVPIDLFIRIYSSNSMKLFLPFR